MAIPVADAARASDQHLLLHT
uniref:Uncharacterized protein n=1 Tax=Vitis vinifera TaxID=29760 RepID=F6HCJ6_VITVI